jgi:hypothetical protein
MRLKAGDRVRVLESYHWAQGATGVVLPHFGDESDTADGVTSFVRTVEGPKEQVWVEFDEPQIDTEGDGPYAAAVIQISFLQMLGTA